MKSEDILFSLDEIGEDLLAETETGLRAESRKPRPWAAIAAVLAAAVCLAGAAALFLHGRAQRRAKPTQNLVMPGVTTEMTGISEPVPDSHPNENPETDKLSLQDCFFGTGIPLVEDRIYRDIDKEIDLSPWSDKDAESAQYLYGYPEDWKEAYPQILLPVFRNAAILSEDSNIGMYLPEEYMELQAYHLAELAEAVVESVQWSETSTLRKDADGSDVTCFAWIRLETDLGQLTRYGNGDYTWIFNEPLAIPEAGSDRYSFPTEPLTDENRGDYMRAWTEALSSPDDEPPHVLPGCSMYYDVEGNVEKHFYLWVNEPFPHENILGYSFWRVTMELDESGRLLAYRYGREDEAGRMHGRTESSHDLLPDLENAQLCSWVPKDQADALFRSGFYITTISPAYFPEGDVNGEVLLEHAAHVEIVYRTDGASLYLPFYRYWIELDSSDLPEGLTRYGAFYVPAIPIEMLTDLPLSLMPGMQSSGDPDPDTGVEQPLPILSLAHCLARNGEEGKLFRNIGNEIALSPCSDFSQDQPKELPVYRNLAYVDESGVPIYLSREQMQARADALISRWNLTVQSEEWVEEPQSPDRNGAYANPSALNVETDRARISVYGNGECTIYFHESLNKDTELAADWIYDPAAPLTAESAAAYAKAWADYCEVVDGLVVQCEPIYGYAETDALSYQCIYYLTEPAEPGAFAEQRLLEYTFHETLYLDQNGNLIGYCTHLASGGAFSESYAAENIGTYPIISKEQADQALQEGFCFTSSWVPLFRNGASEGETLLQHVAAVELVYRTGNDQYFLPYYRYWIESDVQIRDNGLTQYGAYYVPAIPRAYLTDLPVQQMPGAEEDPQLTELKTLLDDPDSAYHRILAAGMIQNEDQIPPDPAPGRVEIEVESYIELSDGELQVRYWRLEDGADKAIFWTAILRKTDDGYQILSNMPAVYN